MKQRSLFSMLVILSLALTSQLVAAELSPALSKGSRTINLEGNLDFQQNNTSAYKLSLGFGYFPFNKVMVKAYVDREDDGGDSTATGLGVGAYYFQPIAGPVSLFGGVRTGWMNVYLSTGRTDSYYASPRVGVLTLISPAAAIYFQCYNTFQSEDIYNNNGTSLDNQDAGLYTGLMIFF